VRRHGSRTRRQACARDDALSSCVVLQMRVDELGRRAPTWVKDQETGMCMR